MGIPSRAIECVTLEEGYRLLHVSTYREQAGNILQEVKRRKYKGVQIRNIVSTEKESQKSAIREI